MGAQCCGAQHTSRSKKGSLAPEKRLNTSPREYNDYSEPHSAEPKWQLYDYSQEPLYKIFMAQKPELGCLRREQISKALIAAKCDADKVVQAFDEMDRDRNKLITYEEFRYYVAMVRKDYSMITVHNFSHDMTTSGVGTTHDETRFEQWRPTWRQKATAGQDKIDKQEAIDCLKDNARQPLSPGMVRALQQQMDVNCDGLIDFNEFSRACDKILGEKA